MRKILIVILACFIATSANAMGEREKVCENHANPVRVIVGKTEFHIPAKYEPDFNDETGFFGRIKENAPEPQNIYNQKADSTKKGYCQSPSQSPFEVTGFTIKQTATGGALKLTSQNKTYEITYSPILSSERANFSAYCEFLTDVKINNKQSRPFSENPEFTEYPALNGPDWPYYYSDKVKLFGNPAVIYCKSEGKSSRSCRLYAPVSEDTVVNGLIFNEKAISPKDWAGMINAYEQFLRSMMPNFADSEQEYNCGDYVKRQKKLKESLHR